MKIKHIITLFILGVIFITIGALFKILHWMYAVELLTIGTILQIIALFIFIGKLFTNKKFKDILNQ